MGKGLRSKVKQRYRAVKREVVDSTVGKVKDQQMADKMEATLRGENVMPVTAKNKFLYPDNPEAVIPKRTVTMPIDFRSEKVFNSGYAAIGNGRKHVRAEREKKKAEEIAAAIARRAEIKKQKEMEMHM